MQSFAAMQQSCTRGKANCEKKEKEECNDEEEEEEEEITTVMQQSCTHGPRLSCLTFFSEQA